MSYLICFDAIITLKFDLGWEGTALVESSCLAIVEVLNMRKFAVFIVRIVFLHSVCLPFDLILIVLNIDKSFKSLKHTKFISLQYTLPSN